MQTPITIQAELLVPLPIPYGVSHTAVEMHLRQAGLLPWTTMVTRWRMDAERIGYVVSYEVVVTIETDGITT
jgi:hypothetical protein